MKFALIVRYIIMLPLLALTLLTTPPAVSTETAELISTDTFVFDQALIMGQGITTDGEFFYTSGTVTGLKLTALAKLSVDGMVLEKKVINPLPEMCVERGNNHIGGISYYNGKIYAPVEGGSEVPACIVVFDAETLEATGEIYDLPKDLYYDGVPWCAVDQSTGYLYASVWNDAKVIHVHDINDGMKLIGDVELTGLGVIDRIQGGEFYNGTLFLSHDIENNGNIKNILSVNVETGEVALVAERDVGKDDVEAEGMTFTEGENGPVLHVLDYNRLIGLFVHHYDVDF